MKLSNKNLLIGGGIALASAAMSSIATWHIHTNWCCNTVYRYAANLYEDGLYKEALSKFEELAGYKYADKYAKLCKEQLIKTQIENLIEEKDYESASFMFEHANSENLLSNRTKDIIHTKLEILHDFMTGEDL